MKHFGIILLIFLFGCQEQTKPKGFFKIILDMKVSKTDNFQIFYTTKLFENYSEKKRVSKIITKDSTYQKILFELPDNLIPNKIRIDLGEIPKINKISIRKIILIKDAKQFVIDSIKMKYFYKPNRYLNYEVNENTFITKIINGKFDPFLKSTPLLNKKLEIYF